MLSAPYGDFGFGSNGGEAVDLFERRNGVVAAMRGGAREAFASFEVGETASFQA